MQTTRRTLFALAAVLAVGAAAIAQTTYTLSDLGVLNTAYPWTRGISINNAGQVAAVTRLPGAATGGARLVRITPTSDGQGKPVWNQDANNDGVNDLIQLLPLPNANYTTSYANPSAGINASGQIAGLAHGTVGSTSYNTGTIWNSVGTPALLTAATMSSNANDVNDAGDGVGFYWDVRKNKPAYAYLWKFANGSYTAISLSGKTLQSDTAYAINSLRQVVGPLSAGSSFLYLDTAAYGLPQGMNAINGITLSTPGKMINNAGVVCGSTPSGHLCLWIPSGGGPYGLTSGVNDLGTGGFSSVTGHTVNNPPSGQPLRVAAEAIDAAGNHFAVVWDSASGAIQDLNTITTNLPAGWVLVRANGINDQGQIVGEATVNGVTRGFVLTPQ